MGKMTYYSCIPEMLSALTQVGNRPFLSILLSKGTTDGAGFSLATIAGSALGLLNISLIAVSPVERSAAPAITVGFGTTGTGGGNTSGITSTTRSGATGMALAVVGAVGVAATGVDIGVLLLVVLLTPPVAGVLGAVGSLGVVSGICVLIGSSRGGSFGVDAGSTTVCTGGDSGCGVGCGFCALYKARA